MGATQSRTRQTPDPAEFSAKRYAQQRSEEGGVGVSATGKGQRPAAAGPTSAKPRMARSGAPAWQGMTGARRIQAEFKYVKQQIDAGQLPQIFGIYMLCDNIYTWRFKLKNFDNDCQSGASLNNDLKQLFR